MIQKFKDLMASAKSLEEIEGKISSLSKDVSSLRSEFESLKKSVDSMSNTVSSASKEQSKLIKAFSDNVGMISSIKSELNDEIMGFSLLRKEAQKQIMDKFAEELEKEINERKEEINIDTGNYKAAKQAIEGLALELAKAREEIRKWLEISSKIKAEDFELVGFAKKLKEADREKLSLLQKIDVLERLVSKLRRNPGR